MSSPLVARGIDEVPAAASAVTIGNFDGVHRGHQLLLRRAVRAAEARGVRAVAITFDPHPAALLRPGSQPEALTSLDERIERIGAAGVDLVVVLPFTRELSLLTPLEFIERVLVDRLQAVRVIVGMNFRFGHDAAGDVVTLVEAGRDHDFDVEAIALRRLGDVPLSSSAIRAALAAGDVGFASAALGRDFRVTGTVVAGDGRGRTIGVPTANVAVAEGVLVPGNGVYAGVVDVDGRRMTCVTNVGVRPTVTDGAQRTVEVHLIDRDLDVYGRRLTVSFAHRLRGEEQFSSVDALVSQIGSDVATARAWLAANRPDGDAAPDELRA